MRGPLSGRLAKLFWIAPYPRGGKDRGLGNRVLCSDATVAALGDQLAPALVAKVAPRCCLRLGLGVVVGASPGSPRVVHVPAALGLWRHDPAVVRHGVNLQPRSDRTRVRFSAPRSVRLWRQIRPMLALAPPSRQRLRRPHAERPLLPRRGRDRCSRRPLCLTANVPVGRFEIATRSTPSSTSTKRSGPSLTRNPSSGCATSTSSP